MSNKYIAFRCLECGVLSVYPSRTADGRCCIECNGYITPVGEARVYKKRSQSINIGVDVDTTQLDIAIQKAERLSKLMGGIPPL
jgi:hypothetical protein